jgi:hypothetical protein
MASSPSETHVPWMASVSTTRSVVSVQRAGMVTGLIFAGWHFLWSVLVASGLAQPPLDFVFWMHFIKPVYVVEAFEPVRAGILIVATGLVGYVIGGVFALLWNRLHRHPR